MDPQGARFDDVKLESTSEEPCSPASEDPTFRGIRINAPARVAFHRDRPEGGGFARVPICGYYLLPVVTNPGGRGVMQELRLVAVDVTSREQYTGPVAKQRTETVPAPVDHRLTDEEAAATAAGGYFNPNLTRHVPLPVRDGLYDVHAELGTRGQPGYVASNTVRIEIIEERR
jgi:hypothetical protein